MTCYEPPPTGSRACLLLPGHTSDHWNGVIRWNETGHSTCWLMPDYVDEARTHY